MALVALPRSRESRQNDVNVYFDGVAGFAKARRSPPNRSTRSTSLVEILRKSVYPILMVRAQNHNSAVYIPVDRRRKYTTIDRSSLLACRLIEKDGLLDAQEGTTIEPLDMLGQLAITA